MAGTAIDRLIQQLSRLPGLGPRSARRATLTLIRKRSGQLDPLIAALTEVRDTVKTCSVCGNCDVTDPCAICADERRDAGLICVVQDVADLWAMERGGQYRGRYHVLGGLLSALDGIGPDELGIPALMQRTASGDVREIIIGLPATVDGQTTAHYLADRIKDTYSVNISALAHGVPVGGELDFLDDGTIGAALQARRPL